VKGAKAGGSRRPFYLALLAVVVIGAGLIGWAMKRTQTSSVITIDPKAAVGIKAEGHTIGSPSAPVEIVEFGDYECPGCAQFATVTEPDVRDRLVNTGQARFRFFAFQVTGAHQNSIAAALAAECASEQGKFWEMHDKLFAGQYDWNTQATSNPKSIFAGYAKQIGIDIDKWSQCFDSRKYLGQIAANSEEAVRQKVAQTPTLIIGDKQYAGAQAYDVIKAAVDSAKTKVAAAPTVDTTKK
jgi:protein-disulfide isomerase